MSYPLFNNHSMKEPDVDANKLIAKKSSRLGLWFKHFNH